MNLIRLIFIVKLILHPLIKILFENIRMIQNIINKTDSLIQAIPGYLKVLYILTDEKFSNLDLFLLI